jgi:hypothetical protein
MFKMTECADQIQITELKKIATETKIIRDFFTPALIPGVQYRLVNGKQIGYRQYGLWDEKRGSGYEVTYEHTVTYSGSTYTINLDFPNQTMIKRFEMTWWNAGAVDTTSKDYEIRVFSDFNNDSYYSVLKKSVGNTESSDITFSDFVYPAGSRLQLFFENYTTTRVMKILVAIEVQ